MTIDRIGYMVNKCGGLSTFIILLASTFSLLLPPNFLFPGVYGIEFFSEGDAPFGIPYDDWVAKYWNWWIAQSKDEVPPKKNGCLINNSEKLVMLMETADVGTTYQVCNITSEQGILIPLWIGWCDAGDPRTSQPYQNEPLSKCAREVTNLGTIVSDVKVDNRTAAKLSVRLLPSISGSLDYTITSLDNVTELSTADFNLTIPGDTYKPEQTPGTWRAGSHGWWVVLKPLPPGEHTVSYNVVVTPPGASTGANIRADITYLLNVV
jgi:hypothetical protein